MVGPDTRLGWRAEEVCADCGVAGCNMATRQSSLVPGAQDTEGPFIPLCVFCYDRRAKRKEEGKHPLPLGVKPPGVPEQFLKKAITVITQSGSEYKFELPEEDGTRTVSCETRDIGFKKCKILLLKKGESLCFRGVDVDPREAYWQTSPVSSIY
ncbi:hypothetical protein AMJ50_02570 [Parcubacteria bacterium DG_74_3]|nr:MAG: hypothetical protein AMJ50_02570 [Parcubacteria bacterium DG_74_3]